MKWLIFSFLILASSVSLGEDADNTLKKIEEIVGKQKTVEENKQNVAVHLQDISVTIVSKSGAGSGGEGSGVVKTRKLQDGSSVNFIWTAAHVIDNLRKTRSAIDPKTGTQKTVVEFDDAMVVKSISQEGRTVGKLELMAEVIRYSKEEDLALLKLRKKDFIQSSVVFHLDNEIPPIGTDLLHVGSLLGQVGSNSMTTGIMSQHGRIIDKKVFDQTTVNAFPGSSGGGVYTKDGKMIGMLVRGAGETFNLIVPVRRIRDWARHAKIEWAIDDNIPVPSDQDLERLPVEDSNLGHVIEESSLILPGLPKNVSHKIETRLAK
jgi:S1-C subfamily serine protease